MNRTDTIVFTVRFLGAVLVAIGISGAVVSGYAMFQENTGLCGTPELENQSSGSTVAFAGPPTLSASNLSSGERGGVAGGCCAPGSDRRLYLWGTCRRNSRSSALVVRVLVGSASRLADSNHPDTPDTHVATTGDHPQAYLRPSVYNRRDRIMSDERDDPNVREGFPGCPNCGSNNVERTPVRQSEYQCIDCGDEFDEGGRGVIVR